MSSPPTLHAFVVSVSLACDKSAGRTWNGGGGSGQRSLVLGLGRRRAFPPLNSLLGARFFLFPFHSVGALPPVREDSFLPKFAEGSSQADVGVLLMLFLHRFTEPCASLSFRGFPWKVTMTDFPESNRLCIPGVHSIGL